MKAGTVSPPKGHKPIESDPTVIHNAEKEHDKTLAKATPINVEETLAVHEGEAKIFQQEREIIDTKMVEPTAMPVAFDQLTWGDNVRTSKTLRLEGMIASMKQRGYNPKYPIVVSRKPLGKGKFSHLILCGNRRTEALKKIKEAEPDVFKLILPKGTVPALVFDNLTEAEEIILRNDHSDEEDRVQLYD